MRPAVPPEFRLKANTLTADNGAIRIRLGQGLSSDLLRREMP